MTNNPVTMSLEINDMVFKSILDNLYTDLPLAIVREICCNAVDSHLVARNYEPFLVQKPSESNPYFIVRDFGTGLSKENVYKYLNTLLSSNKKEEADLTGQYGLGSKAVLAYNESYKVISYYEGVCYEFLFKRINKGVPTLELLSEIPTEEPNGLKYIVSVSPQNIEVFNSKLHLLKYFRIPPRIFLDIDNPSTEIFPDENDAINQIHEGFYYFKYNSSSGRNYSHFLRTDLLNVRLSDVIYNVSHIINTSHNSVAFRSNNIYFSLIYLIFPSSGFIVDMDSSCLDLPLNRENIILNSKNSELILSNILENIKDFLNKLIQNFNELNETNYSSFLNFLETALFYDIIKFSKFLFDNFKVPVTSTINLFSTISSERLPSELNSFNFQNFCFTNSSGVFRRVVFSIYNLSYLSLNKEIDEILFCKITTDLTFTKLDNYSNKNALNQFILGLNFTESFSQEEETNVINVISQMISILFPNIEIKFKTEDEIKQLLVVENRLRARERRVKKVAATPSTKLLGVKLISNLSSSYNYRRMPTCSTIYNDGEPISLKVNAEGKPASFVEYFPEAKKYLVLCKNDNLYTNIDLVRPNSVYSFDKILITTEKMFQSIVNSLRSNSENLVYTLENISTYSLISVEDQKEMNDLFNKDNIRLALNKIFLSKEEMFNEFQIKLVQQASLIKDFDPLFLEALEDLNSPSELFSYLTNKRQTLNYIETSKYDIYKNTLVFNFDVDSRLKEILTPEFLIANKDLFLKVINSTSILKHFIEVTS